jgi:coproporphyrinogen III oxidase
MALGAQLRAPSFPLAARASRACCRVQVRRNSVADSPPPPPPSATAAARSPATQTPPRPPPQAARAPAPRRRGPAPAAAAPPAIEKEEYVAAPPGSLLRPGVDDPSSMRGQFEKAIRAAQDSIVAAVEELDGTPFRQDAWTRPGGGGGITRVLQGGNVWEKAGVNVSVVYGSMPAEAYRAAVGRDVGGLAAEDRVPFFAAGISSVMHPKNPHVSAACVFHFIHLFVIFYIL